MFFPQRSLTCERTLVFYCTVDRNHFTGQLIFFPQEALRACKFPGWKCSLQGWKHLATIIEAFISRNISGIVLRSIFSCLPGNIMWYQPTRSELAFPQRCFPYQRYEDSFAFIDATVLSTLLVLLYSQLFHVPFLDAWVLPCCALVDCVQLCCNELLHNFSLDYLNGSITHTTGRLANTIVQGNCLSKFVGQETCR